jgi:hypothetical protein
MQAPLEEVKQGLETNKERFLINNNREVVSFRPRMRLVVAMRIHVRYSSFQLRILSNTSSVLMNDAHGPFANSDKEMRLLSCNFCLKKRLGEPAEFKPKL